MLYQAPRTSSKIVQWLRRIAWLRPAHPVTDIRELSPYLRADIGAPGGNYPFRG
jgi:hypothetical protein